MGKEGLLGHFFPNTFPSALCWGFSMEWRWIFFSSLISYSDIVLLLLPAAEIIGLTIVFRTSFSFKSSTAISSLPSFWERSALLQEIAKKLLLQDIPSWHNCLYSSGRVIFSGIPSWISLSCFHSCLPFTAASVLALGEGAVRCFRVKDATAQQLDIVLQSLNTQTVLTNGGQQWDHEPWKIRELICVRRPSLISHFLEIPSMWFLGPSLLYLQKHRKHL